MNAAFLLIGGNMGDRLANLQQAEKAIGERCGSIKNASALYETAAWGFEEQPSFLNQALCVATRLEALPLLEEILQIERSLGRTRSDKYGPRLIDIDILLFNQDILSLPGLKVPHPQLQHRRFALQCLADIAPNVQH